MNAGAETHYPVTSPVDLLDGFDPGLYEVETRFLGSGVAISGATGGAMNFQPSDGPKRFLITVGQLFADGIPNAGDGGFTVLALPYVGQA